MSSAVVLGASPTGLAVVRALGAQGVHVHVGDTDGWRHAFRSRYRRGPRLVGRSPAATVQRAVEWAEASSISPVFIPTSDAMVLALSDFCRKHPGRLRTYDAISSGLAARTVDKESFYELCQSAGVETPQTAFPKSADEVLRRGNEFQFPLLLKPILGHLWRDRLRGAKLLVAHSLDELKTLVDQFGDDCEGLMVQELIPGEETNIYVAAVYRGKRGGRDCCFVAEKTRQYPPDFGSASLATAKYQQEIVELSWRFVEGVDFRGICGTEFKLDPRDGHYKMIEVNPRPTLWFHLALASGVPLLHAAYQDLVDQPLPVVQPQRDGTRWCFLEKDLLTWP
ncbi:MAG: ATP-grasp domain-containing protein, partial [Pirellulales bacterium]|nr:ATP-grasp domain-containing protein [Pirellulales bacterium]